MHVYILVCKIPVNPMTLQGLSQNLRGEHPLHQAMYVIPALSVALAALLWAGARAMASSLW
jgi:hypothetical protein